MTTLKLKYIRDQYLLGKSPKEIAKDVDVCQATIYRYVKDIKFRYRNWRFIEKVVKEYLSGEYTRKEICERYHICDNTLYNYVRRYVTENNLNNDASVSEPF